MARAQEEAAADFDQAAGSGYRDTVAKQKR
jgi:hypothetical protein